MKITQVYRTRNGVVGPTSINGYGIIKINGLRYDGDENKYYDSEDNEVILEEGREYYSNNKLYVYDGKLIELLTDLMIEIKWAELVELRDNKELIPGMKYRITDYQCTTTQENTRSAGHQFDIVLLALSENKLAEEGWAMEHPTDVYDVTFSDGVTKKCYFNTMNGKSYDFIDVATLLACDGMSYTDFTLDDVNKTATCIYDSTDLSTENITYNYFQNSNLSAWKVWYCLDNDKSRFSWADEGSIIPGELISVTFGEKESRTGTPTSTIIHKSDGDYILLTGTGFGAAYYYKQGTTVGDYGVYVGNGNPADPTMGSPSIITSINSTEPTILPEGHGVIYRLIDEWNNDIPYDFKNIQIYSENSQLYLYAISDVDAVEEDPTLDGIRAKALHLLSNYNNKLGPVANGGLSRTAIENTIFINNSIVAHDVTNTIVRDGRSVIS